MRPRRRQPTRLPYPWDSLSKNNGEGCHFLLQCMKVKSQTEVTQSCLTLSDPHGLQPTRLLHPWDFPGKSTGVGCHCLLLDISKIKLLLKKNLRLGSISVLVTNQSQYAAHAYLAQHCSQIILVTLPQSFSLCVHHCPSKNREMGMYHLGALNRKLCFL